MNQTKGLPALIRSSKPGSKYHITDDGKRTRCGRRIESLTESHPLDLDENDRCPKCGTTADFELINDLRSMERRSEDEARKVEFHRIDEIRNARNTVRPELTNIIAGFLAKISEDDEITLYQHFLNVDKLYRFVNFNGQEFTIKIEVWNGEKDY